MPMTSIGDMSLQFATMRQTTQIKTRLGVLTNEMSTGVVGDLTAHLGGDSSRLSDIDHRLGLIAGYGSTAQETAQLLATMQTTLQGIDSTRSALSTQLVSLHSSASAAQIDTAVGASLVAFDSMTRAFNTRFSDRSLFAGTATDTSPLAEPDAMIAAIRVAVAGSLTAADVQTAINTWFDSPTGGFATMGYLGDTNAAPSRRIDPDTNISIEGRADDPALRNLLKAAAMAAIAGDPGLALSDHDKGQLIRDAGQQLLTGAQPLVNVQARLGLAEATVEESTVRQSAQKTAYGIMRNDLVSADPYDTATALQQVQQQLEMHYTLTARLSRISLVEYL